MSEGHATALKDLVTSEGWRLFCDEVERQWGASACLQKIDVALQALERGDREGHAETVTQIRTAARQIAVLLRWPQDELSKLTAPEKASSPFEKLRRMAR